MKQQLERAGLGRYCQKKLRRMICDFLELGLSVDGQDILSDFLPNNNLKEFVRNMGVNMTYADHVIVEYMSRMLEQPITVVRSPFHILIGQDYKDKPMLFLGYLADMHHYVSIKPERNRDQQQDGVTIETEQHYAVDYVDRFYAGRVLKKGKSPRLLPHEIFCISHAKMVK